MRKCGFVREAKPRKVLSCDAASEAVIRKVTGNGTYNGDLDKPANQQPGRTLVSTFPTTRFGVMEVHQVCSLEVCLLDVLLYRSSSV